MVGSFLFRLLSPSVRPHSTLLLSTLLFLLSSLLASLLATSPSPYAKLGCLGAFILIEISLGLYFPSIGTLRRYTSFSTFPFSPSFPLFGT